MIELSPQQQQAVKAGEPVQVQAPEIGGDVVVLRAESFAAMQEVCEEVKERDAWARLSRKSIEAWCKENPF